ncbi:hypothetical protein H7J77_12180 [Mycolicibacillus parakoreensis]|uniref:Lipoprotein LpqJ n=1 Tax=Mycolicibacillus parakoreensis TaxID=1069221 RepID=A0ABY3U4U5_9MYCO|nr:hypothetical protein [Mycolicibacillus parakoreensis]MCV7316294.1 hypothetical protein [Mycolicibacillus parakoreensis]ULN52542.1 hypothetical protein MIU77_17160 [Mycolicibacillus parakoreensis]HLR99414.1 hypothetical protein [Mycolicibacillus parakoreensis]
MNTGRALALLGVALVAGCTTTIDGRPVPGPGAGPPEPTFPSTTRPPVHSPTPSTPAPTTPATPGPGTPSTPPGSTELPADDAGLVFIETKSGKTRCQISVNSVGCEAQFTDSPLRDGEHANGVRVTSDGDVEWVLGNLGAIPAITLDYRGYVAQGWTIDAGFDGTRFTNIDTGHGMFVSIERVDTF